MIRIPQAIYDEMVVHARECLPDEACGFLVGSKDVVSSFRAMRNTEASPTSYAMDPKTQIRIFREIDMAKLELIGIFHSHPVSLAEPSPKDRAMAFYPEVSYLILSLKNPDKPKLKAFRIIDERQAVEEICVE